MNGRPITLVSLTPKQIYEKQLNFKKEMMILFGFDDDDIIQVGTDLFIFKDVFHYIYSRSNLFKEREDDTNQVKSKFDLKMSANRFCVIRHTSQIVHWNELKFYREILDT
jgi:hypothetical protein